MMPAAAIYFGLVLARVAAFVLVFPLFAGRTPRMVRTGMALALAGFYVAVVAPGWVPLKADDITDFQIVAAILREAMIGAAVGVVFNLFLLPARVAGEFLNHQVGLALSGSHGLGADAPTGMLPLVFEVAASLLFLSLDAHHVALAALHSSFSRLPLGGSFVPPDPAVLLDGLASAHETGLLIAGPLALCLFLLMITLALTARAAPQLSIFSVGFAMQVLIALGGMVLLMPEIVNSLAMAVQRSSVTLQALWR